MELVNLLSRGYFPKELPRPFVTEMYGQVICNESSLPQAFCAKAGNSNDLLPGKPSRYSHARGGLLRRYLSICNPIHNYLLSKEIVGNWKTLEPYISNTNLSASCPEFKTKGRAIDSKSSQDKRSEFAQKSRLGRRYVLRTDISRFYPSIYTHIIPWAIHTKTVAKSSRNDFRLLGNKLDYWVRMGQDRQTVGIPIGPDTSLVIAEIIMQRCDEILEKKMGSNIRGFRFVDDYELSCSTKSQAEEAFSIIEDCLSSFELALNPKKTQILELPLPFEPSWVIELRSLSFRDSIKGQAADLTTYFSRVFALHSENLGDAVLKYAIRKLRRIKIRPENWKLFQRLLLLCVMPEPSCLAWVLDQLIIRKNQGAEILNDIEEIVNTLIIEHSSKNHSSEVAHSLWACLALNLNICNSAVDKLSQFDDPVVALLALDCESHGLTLKPLDKALWCDHMIKESLYDEFWLLSYEANVKGWLPSKTGTDHVGNDASFSFLKANGVRFYDQSLATPQSDKLVPFPKLPQLTQYDSLY